MEGQNSTNNNEPRFLDKDIDFKAVHYIEKRAKQGDTDEDIRKDLMKGGNDSKKIDKLFGYVSEHRIKIHEHDRMMRIILIISGSIFVTLLIISSLFFFKVIG